MPEQDTPDEDELDQFAADLAQQTEQKFQQSKEEQQEFLDNVAEEEGAEVLETSCNIIGDYTVDLRAKLNGEVMDAMGRIQDRLERLEGSDAAAYEVSEAADEVAQLLADVIDDSEWHKRKFYAAYEAEGLDPLGVMLDRVFNDLKEEKERREGAADGFRAE